MKKLRPLPERVKFQHAFEMVRLYQKHVLPFVEERLGYASMHNLRSVWQAAIIPIHEDESCHDKYEQAYSNWLWIARCSHSSLAEELSDEEVLDYKRLLLRLYEQELYNPDLSILRLLRTHTAHAKALLYEMQWMTPIELTKNSKAQVTCEIHDCKIRQTPGTELVCRVDCQHIGKAYASKVYHIKRVTTPSDHGCSITLTPLGK
jgi:hypothetical protein